MEGGPGWDEMWGEKVQLGFSRGGVDNGFLFTNSARPIGIGQFWIFNGGSGDCGGFIRW